MSRTSVLAAVTLAGTALVAGPTLAASAHPGSHHHTARKPVTISFTAKQSGTVVQSGTGFAISDTDVQGSKKIGADVLSCTEGSGSSTCSLAFASRGGLIYAHIVLSESTGKLTGRVTGGTGPYLHATGSASGQSVSRSTTKVTLTYTT